MLVVGIIIAVLLLWVVRCLYQVCKNQVSQQKRTEEILSKVLDKLDKTK